MATVVTRVEMYIPVSFFDSDFNEVSIAPQVNTFMQTLNAFTFDSFVQYTQSGTFFNGSTIPFPGRSMNFIAVNILSAQRTALNAAFTAFVATLDSSIQSLCFFVAFNAGQGT